MNVDAFMWILWCGWLLQGLFGWYNIWAYRRNMRAQDVRLALPLENHPPLPVLFMAPMKGVRDNFESFIDGLLNQDYPNYHLVFSVESTNDPLYATLRDRLGLDNEKLVWEPSADGGLAVSPGLKRVRMVVAGLCEIGSQKVHNQLAALKELRAEDAFIATCDADILPPRDMLHRLLSPLNQGSHAASTGYRWLIPLNRNLGMLVATVINASVATMGGPERWNLMWGGAHALTREAHEKIALSEKFVGAFNDDLQTAHYVHRAGMKIAYIRSFMLPIPEDYDWAAMFTFGWRQYFHARFYAPWAWWTAFFVTGLYLGGCFSAWTALLAGGNLNALIPLGLMLVLNERRAHERIALVKTLFSGEYLERLKPTFKLERFATGFCMLIHFLIICRSTLSKTVAWSGTTYRVTGRQKVKVLHNRRHSITSQK